MRSSPPRGTAFPAARLNRALGGWFIGSLIRPDSSVEGIHHLREAWERHREGVPLVLICNHASYADSHIIEQMLIRVGFRELTHRLYHLAGQKTYRTLWRRFFTFGINTIKVIQSAAVESPEIKRRQARESFRAFKHVVAKDPVLFFPEATRTRTGRMGEASPALVNYLRGNLVLPMALHGSREMLGVGSVFPWFATIVLRIGAPFIAHPVVNTDKHHEMAAYVQRIIELLDPTYWPESLSAT